MSVVNYSKWDHIEVSDDEDDTHPNVDTPSLFKWRHEARLQREEQARIEKAKRLQEKEKLKKEVQETAVKAKEDASLVSKLTDLELQKIEFEKKEAELERYEREHPTWNVDNMSKDKVSRTIINKAATTAPVATVSTDDPEDMSAFWKKYEADMKKFGLLSKYEESHKFLQERPHLVSDHMASFLGIWCIDLCVEEKEELMKRVAHQAIVMQYILELAKSLQQDPRACVPGFFKRIETAEKQYKDAFQDEYKSFLERVHGRAQARLEKARAEAEEEERQARLGPGGLDPLEVLESLPEKIKVAFKTQNTPMLQQSFAELSKDDFQYHYKRVIDSGLWVPAKGDGGSGQAEEAGEEEEEEHEEDAS